MYIQKYVHVYKMYSYRILLLHYWMVAFRNIEFRGSFHKAILATIDLSYLRLILRLFTSAPRNNFKTIVNPAHVCLHSVKFTVPTVEVINLLILAYDDRKVRSFCGTGCQS